MDQRYLRYFIAVAEELNFTRAAERLHTVQPSLSQQIRRLEEIVGTPLFVRTKHRLELTEAGRIFLEESRAILQQTNRALELARKAARAEAGHITIGVVSGGETVLFAQVLPMLRQKYPEIRLSLRTFSEPKLLEALQSHAINAGFVVGPVEDPELFAEPMYRHQLVAVLPANHALAKLKRVSVPELATLSLVRPSPTVLPGMMKVINSLAAQHNVRFEPSLDVDDSLSTLSAVGAGLGFAIMPNPILDVLPQTTVARPLNIAPEPTFEIVVAYRKDDRLPALKFFLSLLREKKQQQGAQ